MVNRLEQIAFIIANLESNLRLAGKASKIIGKEKMRFRERLSRLPDEELSALVRLAEIDAQRRGARNANTH